MANYHINLSLPALIVAVTLPAASAYLYYHATQDPTLRPLGVTQEELAVTDNAGNTAAINVRLDWGEDTTLKLSHKQVQETLTRTLAAFNAEFWFTINTVPGNRVRVSYHVGANKFGPYPITDTTDGLRVAVETQRVIQAANQPPAP